MSWIKVAEKVAKKSQFRHKVGAVIIKGGRVLSVGYNEIRYAKIKRPYPESLHAEVAAIYRSIQTGHDLSGASIYVCRASGDSFRLSKPCPHCMSLIKTVGIKKVVWSEQGDQTRSVYLV